MDSSMDTPVDTYEFWLNEFTRAGLGNEYPQENLDMAAEIAAHKDSGGSVTTQQADILSAINRKMEERAWIKL